MMRNLWIVAACVVLLAGTAAFAQLNSTPREETWVTNGTVNAIVTTSTTTYIGGHFTYVGPNTGNGVPIDAGTGAPVAVYPKVNGSVYDSVPDGADGWYIGGYFTQVGTVARNNIAHILPDGNVDPAWNPNANSTVYALAVSGTTVYAGGWFTSIGGQTRNRIAALDTVTGLATTWNPNANSYLRALAVSGTTVYAGGDFTSIGGQTRNRIAMLDSVTGLTTTWDPNADDVVWALAVSGTTVYVGGEFTSIGGQTRNRIAALNNTTGLATAWDPNADGLVFTLAVSGTTVYAGGEFITIGGQTRNYIATLDTVTGLATAWNPNANSTVAALAVSGTTVYAGGDFTSIGGQTRNRIAALDATTGLASTWNPNAGGWVLALAVSGTTVYAGGNLRSISGQTHNYIAALDVVTGLPTAWNPNANGDVNALAMSGTTVYAGGDFTSIGGQTRNRIAALDAGTGLTTAWNPNASGGTFPYVDALVVSGTTVYAGGYFWSIGGQTRNSIAALNTSTGLATTWNPNANGDVHALAVSGTTVYAGGYFTSIGGQPRNNIAALNASTGLATTWNLGASGSVLALAVSGTTVYAGGYFTLIGGQTRNRIAALDATTGIATAWNPNASSTVFALGVSGTTVYAGGGFTSIGGQTRNRIAALDATTGLATAWNPNADDLVCVLGVSGTTVYAGGGFTSIGGQARSCFAQFDTPPSAPTAPSNPGATAIGTNTITWLWQDNSNDETGFKVYDSPGAGPPVTLQFTTAAEATSWQHNTLNANAQYAFQVCATNVGGDSTKTTNYTAWTLIEPLSGLTFSNVTPTSISVASTNTPSNLSSGSSGVYFANTTEGTDSGWQQDNTPWASAGLLPNTPYTFSGKSRNGETIETTETTAEKWTLAAQPLIPSVTNICSRSMAVTLTAGDTNPAGTEYCIRVDSGMGGDVWVQADGSLGAAPVYQTMPGWGTVTVTGLTPNMLYGVFATARNGEGVDSAVGLAGYGQTLEGVPPIATLSTTAGDPVNGAITVDVTLSENSTTFEEGDITVVDAIVSDLTGSDASYSFTLTPTLTMSGSFSCVVLAGTFSDLACNPSEEDSNILSRSYDRWPPTLTLSCVASYYVAGAIQVTAVSSEPTVTLEAGDIAVDNATISGFTPQPDGVTFLFQLVPENQGLFSCYVPADAFTDLAENANEDDSNVIERLYDSLPPAGSVVINDGDNYTTAIGVTLTLSGDDGTGSGVTDMQFSNDNAAWSGWEAYAASTAWDLASGDGLKTVYIQFRDAAGHVSTDAITDTITLDTADPAFTEITATPDTAAEGDVVTLSFHGSEPLQDTPEVTVNGNAADHVSGKDGADYVYSYTVLDPTRDPIGPATIEISGFDLAGNPGMATNNDALTIIKLISVPIATLPMLAGLSIACAVAGVRMLRRKK